MHEADIWVLERDQDSETGACRAAGIAERAGFQLRWRAHREPSDGVWVLEELVADGRRRRRIDAYEIVTSDDFEAFRRLVVEELERRESRREWTG